MILYEKILEKYSLEEIKNAVSQKAYYKLKKNEEYKVLSFAKLDLTKIEYNVNEFIKDYPQYKEHVEKETLLNLFKHGVTVEHIHKNSVRNFYKHIRDGFIYKSKLYKGKTNLLKLLVIDYDISNFRLEKYTRHIELYGDKNQLEKFREHYKISYGIIYEKFKEEWHLAFDGLLAEYIKVHENQD